MRCFNVLAVPAAAVLSTTLCALSASAPFAAHAQVTIRLSTFVNEVDVRHKGLQKFAELVDKNTSGRVKVQIFGSSTLHPFDKGIDAVVGGVSDVSPLTLAAVDKRRLPCAYVTQMMPVSVDWERHVDLDREYNALLKDEFARQGLVVVMSSNASYDQEWFFRTPVDKLDEGMKGRLVRSPGSAVTHIITKWGGKPVFTGPTETYQSAERGVVDGINMGVATFSSWKLWNVMPHMINANLFYNNIMYAMNKKKFDALSPQDQAAIMNAGMESARWIKPLYESWINEQVGAAVMKNGATVKTLTKAERARLINSAGDGWNNQIESACGAELGGKLRALFKKYER